MASNPPAPIAANQTIVLLEENKNAVSDPNGTFSINLPKPIVLKEGDALQLTKAFVDTSILDSNVINVTPEERSVTIQTGIYFTDVTDNTDGTTPGYGLWSEENRPNDPCRGQTYILQDQSSANLNTFFDWLGANNLAVTPAPPDFNVELIPVADNDPADPLIGKAEYIVKGGPDLGGAPADPASQNTPLVQPNMLNGYMNLKVVNDAHQFFFYHRTSTAATFDEPNGHTAIIEGWFDTASPPKRKGWKAKRNVDSTFASGNPPFTQWFFKGDAGGYNYFADRGTGHLVRMTQAFFPFNKDWDSSENPAAIDFSPSVTIQYKNPSLPTEKQYQSMTKNFTKYIPLETPGVPINPNSGVTELYLRMTDANITPNPINRAVEVKFKHLPQEYKGKENGWGRNWAWFYWNNWEDPLDVTGQRVWDPIVYSIDEPPFIAYTNYKSGGVPNSQPIDQAFVNIRSQYFERVLADPKIAASRTYEGTKLQRNQLTTSPVSNPTSNGCIMSPRQYTTTIDIPPKAYGYAELAQLITDKLNALANPIVGVSNNPADLNQPFNAPGFTSSYIFQTTYDLMMQYNGFNTAIGGAEIPKNPIFPNPWTFSKIGLQARPDDGVPDPVIAVTNPAAEGVQPFWVNEEANILFSFNQATTNGNSGADPHIVGAENMSLIFDDVTQSFNFLEAHTPFYIRGPEIQAAVAAGTGSNPTPAVPAVFGPGPEVVYQIQGRSTTTSFRPTLNTKDVYSGCFITDLQPRTLWFDKMKFSDDILTHIAPDGGQVTPFNTGSFTGNTALGAVKTHPISVTTGRNKTGFFIGHDTLVTKNENFDTMGSSPSTDNYWNEIIEVDTPVGLKANSQTPVNDDQAFYQIEISGINSQEITGQVYNNSLVQAIVGKYFSAGNFTQSIGDGVPYVHKGEPLTIQSVRIRILNTQNELEPGLGPNSSFVLTINTQK